MPVLGRRCLLSTVPVFVGGIHIYFGAKLFGLANVIADVSDTLLLAQSFFLPLTLAIVCFLTVVLARDIGFSLRWSILGVIAPLGVLIVLSTYWFGDITIQWVALCRCLNDTFRSPKVAAWGVCLTSALVGYGWAAMCPTTDSRSLGSVALRWALITLNGGLAILVVSVCMYCQMVSEIRMSQMWAERLSQAISTKHRSTGPADRTKSSMPLGNPPDVQMRD